jgi:hypothetical protein
LRSENIADLIGSLTGEQLESSIEKHHSLLAFTNSYAIKLRVADSVPREVVTRDKAWLAREGLRPRLLHVDYDGELFSALIMERLPSSDCAAYRLVNDQLSDEDAAVVVRYLKDYAKQVRSTSFSREVLGDHVLQNFNKQVANGAEFERIQIWRSAVESALTIWSRGDEECLTAVHRNAFSPNVFLDPTRGVVLIDPRSQTDSFSELPWFGDAATFAVDLVIHSWYLRDVPSLAVIDTGSDTWCCFLAVMLVKLLVRYRFCRYELGARKESWRQRQDQLVVSRAEVVADEIADTIERIVTGTDHA